MFSFFKNKRRVDLAAYLRHINDITTPNRPVLGDNQRAENRYNRVFPVLTCPWKRNAADVENILFGLTRDISDRGISIILRHPHPASDLVVALWTSEEQSSEPWFFIGSKCNSVPMGAGYWSIGIELHSFANADHADQLESLRPFAARLLPSAVADEPVSV